MAGWHTHFPTPPLINCIKENNATLLTFFFANCPFFAETDEVRKKNSPRLWLWSPECSFIPHNRPSPLYINGEYAEQIETIKFLGVLPEDISVNTTATVKSARQRLHFLSALRMNNMDKRQLICFYHVTIESILTYCISVGYAGCSKQKEGCSWRMEDVATSCYLSRAKNITRDCSYPVHYLFDLLPSGRRCRDTHQSIQREFFPQGHRYSD